VRIYCKHEHSGFFIEPRYPAMSDRLFCCPQLEEPQLEVPQPGSGPHRPRAHCTSGHIAPPCALALRIHTTAETRQPHTETHCCLWEAKHAPVPSITFTNTTLQEIRHHFVPFVLLPQRIHNPSCLRLHL